MKKAAELRKAYLEKVAVEDAQLEAQAELVLPLPLRTAPSEENPSTAPCNSTLFSCRKDRKDI